MPTLDRNVCAICAHNIHRPECPHPWRQPFEKWPPVMRNQLKDMVPHGFDPDPPQPQPEAA